MKKSNAAAIGAGAVVISAGGIAAALCPLAGFIGGAYWVASSASALGMSTAAVWALGAAGAIGGAAIGRALSPVVLLGGVALGAVAVGATKAVAVALGLTARSVAVGKKQVIVVAGKKQAALRTVQKKVFELAHVKPSFDAAIRGINDNAAKAAPAAKPAHHLKFF